MNYFELGLKNGDLAMDMEKIAGYDPPITIAKAYEPQFDNEDEGYPFGIDVEDHSYWYANTDERNHDYEILHRVFGLKFYFVD